MSNHHIDTTSLLDEITQIEQKGQTVMLIAYDQILRGYIAVADTVKSEAKVAVQELKDMNLRTVMITGDNHSTAQAIK